MSQTFFEMASQGIKSITNLWPIKIAVSLMASVLTSAHAIAFYVFCALIAVDLITKIIALSRNQLVDLWGESNKSDFLTAMNPKNILIARRKHYIKSGVMKYQFSKKIFLYISLTLSAVCVDYFAIQLGYKPMLTYLVWVYLAATEFCSILENLQDSGLEEAKELNTLIHDKVKYIAMIGGASAVITNDNTDGEKH